MRAHLWSKWNPTRIPGCALWLEADRGITLDGSNNVSAWADQSGNGRHAAQTTLDARPAWSTAAYNGMPGITFDGINDYMVMTSLAQPIDITAIVIAYRTSAAKYQPLIRGDTSPPYGFSCYSNHGTGGKPITYTVTYNAEWGAVVDTLAIHEFRGSASQNSISVNGGYPVSSIGGPGQRLIWSRIGGHEIYGQYFGGIIFAAVIYHRLLSTQETASILAHYSNKYCITLEGA